MKLRYAAVFTVLSAALLAALYLNLTIGGADISPAEALKILFRGGADTASDIIMKIRVPRAMAALILGGALSLSGYLLQTFFRNPIAGPFVLGVSSGAKLTVALIMVAAAESRAALTSGALISAAFIGSLASLALVLTVSRSVGSMSTLVVCGVMIGYICSAMTDFVVTFAADSDIVNLRSWSLGTFSGMNMDNVRASAVVTASGLALTLLLAKPIGAYRLGESYAQNLGVRIKPLRAALILLSGLLSACVTAFAGPISFVGIAVPHIVRTALKTSKPVVLIPSCFLGGSVFCMLCDLISRTAFAPTELSISTVTAIFGAPAVIAAMLRQRRDRV